MCNYLPSKMEMNQFNRVLILRTAIKLNLRFCIYSYFWYYRDRSIYLYVLAQKLHFLVSNTRFHLNNKHDPMSHRLLISRKRPVWGHRKEGCRLEKEFSKKYSKRLTHSHHPQRVFLQDMVIKINYTTI